MKKILIVEDDYNVRRNIEDLLNEEGFQTITAEDGYEGYKLASSQFPDLILSDIQMPKMNGIELVKKLQKNPVTSLIPFIFLTARVEVEDMRLGMSSGADDYIFKPYKADDLLNAINLRLIKNEKYLSVIKEFRDVLIRKVPHELRTPLVGILGLSDIMQNDIDSLSKEELKDIAARIQNSGKRLHRRIEKFITYTELLHLNQIKVYGEYINEDFFEVTQEKILELLIKKAEEFDRTKDLNIQMEQSKITIPQWQYEILLNELVENSFKFTPKGSSVFIEGKNDGNYYVTKILDSDSGIKNINYENIKAFNKFDDLNSANEGLGIGLAIVKEIIELTNGYLSFDSIDKVAGIVKVGLPLRKNG
jgi:DNA-binding response OmpR family regulator